MIRQSLRGKDITQALSENLENYLTVFQFDVILIMVRKMQDEIIRSGEC